MRRSWIQHKANPLHLYCRMIDLGLSAALSRRVGVLYEQYLYTAGLKGLVSRWTSMAKRFLSLG